MRLFQLSAALILCTSMLCAADDDSTTQDKPKLPDAAQRIMDGYHKDADVLERDYLRKLQSEERKVLSDLDKASKDSARKGDVDGAVAIRDQIKLLEDKLDHEKPASKMFAEKEGIVPAEMVGTWDIMYDNGATRKLSIDEDGNALVIRTTYEGTGWKYKITQDPKTHKLHGISDPLGRVETYTLKGKNLSMECWGHGSDYPDKQCEQHATGTMVKTDSK